ncbi:MAG: cytochrome C [Gammaproteobacteria bacterium]|nr:cytochrome C [Gammaproteobacteria bacterium]MDH3508407.1 cytochrome C [Gammaproteobacteria bacterium]
MLEQIRTNPIVASMVLAAVLPITALAQGADPAVQLPEGEPKAFIEGACVACHRLDYLPNARGFTEDGWRALISTMIALPDDLENSVVGYLAEHFPKKPGTDPVLVPGPVEVTISEWLAPTLGSRPHDPAPAADGSIWWAGQYANRIGHVDTATGKTREFPLEIPNSGPHGLVEDGNGDVWFTGNYEAYLGKLDPRTGDVTDYSLPEGVHHPHTPIVDDEGTVWFTTMSGHVGRVDPATEEMKISAAPTDGAFPYGIAINTRGEPWYVDFWGNRLGSVDPVSGEITEYEMPHANSRPRRIALTPDDAVWYTDFPRGYLGRFDPKSGEYREWLSPSGESSQPYGIATIGNVVWYVESFPRPNVLVRFDTETETFQSWPIPSGGGVVRNMMATADGKLVLACSAVNRVALVEIGT